MKKIALEWMVLVQYVNKYSPPFICLFVYFCGWLLAKVNNCRRGFGRHVTFILFLYGR